MIARRCREQQVEQHFVIEGPAGDQQRPELARHRMSHRQKEKRSQRMRRVENRGMQQLRRSDRNRQHAGRDEPVDRYDPDQAIAHELARARGRPARHRHPHDEAADDKENIDAGGKPGRIECAVAQPL